MRQQRWQQMKRWMRKSCRKSRRKKNLIDHLLSTDGCLVGSRDGTGTRNRGSGASGADSVNQDGGRRSISSVELLLGGKFGGSEQLGQSALSRAMNARAHLKNLRQLVLGESYTTADGVSNSSQNLLDLVLGLDVVDWV